MVIRMRFRRTIFILEIIAILLIFGCTNNIYAQVKENNNFKNSGENSLITQIDKIKKENKGNYKFKEWDELRDEIANYIEKIKSDEDDMEETIKDNLPSFLKKLLQKLLKKFG